ncbi:DUF748 domain-containing protein [Magnetospira thiophila]
MAESAPSPTRRPRWPWITGGMLLALLLAVGGLFLASAPLAAYLAEKELRALGLDPKGLETLRLDWWNHEVRLGPVAIGRAGQVPLEVRELGLVYDIKALFDHRVRVRRAILHGADLHLERNESGALLLNKIPLADLIKSPSDVSPPPPDAVTWLVGLDHFELKDSRVKFDDLASGRTLALNAQQLDLKGFFGWTPDQPGTFATTARINDMVLAMEGTATPFAETLRLTLKGSLDEITLAKLQQAVGDLGLIKQAGSFGLRWDQQGSLSPNADLALTGSLALLGEEMDLEYPNIGALTLSKGQMHFAGETELSTAQGLAVRGSLSMATAAGAWEQTDSLAATLEKLSLQMAKLDLERSAEGVLAFKGQPTLAVEKLALTTPVESTLGRGTLALTDLTVQQTADQTLDLQAVGSLDLAEIKTVVPKKGQQAAVSVEVARQISPFKASVHRPIEGLLDWQVELSTDLESLRASLDDGAAARLQMKGLSLDNVTLHGVNDIRVGQISGRGLDATLTDKMAALSGGDEDPAKDPSATPIVLRISKISLDSDSRLTLIDGSVVPPTQGTFDIETLSLSDLALDDPDQAARLDLQGKINKFTPLTLSGWAKPFGPSLSFDMNGNIETLELPTLSPYAAQAVGMNLDGGRLTANGSGKVEGGILDGKLDLQLDKLAFTPLSEEDRKRLSDQVGMPVETVVGLLEDSDGRIKLTLPVKGDLAAPEFDLSDAINQAVGGAIQAAAGGLFKVLFPPAALISLIIESENGGVSFKPVVFDAGSAKLSATVITHGDNLALVLQERPKLSIRLCGRATGADFKVMAAEARAAALAQKIAAAPKAKTPPELTPEDLLALDQQLQVRLGELAVARTRNLKQYLIESHELAADRLAECRSLFDAKDTLAPRVEVTF